MPEMPPVGGYPHTNMPHLVGQLPDNEPIWEVNPTNLVLMLELNDPKGKKKVNESSLEQTSDVEIQRIYNLLEERLMVLEGDNIYRVVDARSSIWYLIWLFCQSSRFPISPSMVGLVARKSTSQCIVEKWPGILETRSS